MHCDGRLLAQALTNIVKNAVESITTRRESSMDLSPPDGCINVTLVVDDQTTTIRVSDNGAGLPVEIAERLTEPYVTTRSKGTGLGLAIVRKIMADHGGEVILENRDESGAVVSLVFSHLHLREIRDNGLSESAAPLKSPQTLASVE